MSQGYTTTEKLLTRLGKKAFLQLWAYPNTFREKGKELCDLLVVFENDIIIFSDKNIQYPTKLDKQKNWKRWKNRAINKSIFQLNQAEKHILKNPDKIFIDSKCKETFLVDIPKNPKIYKIAIANGAAEACKRDSKNNIYGSISVLYHENSFFYPEQPDERFVIRLNKEDTIHLLNEENLSTILSELDTIKDFINYLSFKEKIIKDKKAIIYVGEEDLLAAYIQTKGTLGNSDVDVLAIREGEWDRLKNSPTYPLIKEIYKTSYIWDDIINIFIKEIEKNNLISTPEDPRIISSKKDLSNKGALLGMAKENRKARIVLSESIMELIAKHKQTGKEQIRFLQGKDFENSYVIFLTGDLFSKYNDPHIFCTEILTASCIKAYTIMPCPSNIIGIAFDNEKIISASLLEVNPTTMPEKLREKYLELADMCNIFDEYKTFTRYSKSLTP